MTSLKRTQPGLIVALISLLSLFSTIACEPALAQGDEPSHRAAVVTKPYWEEDMDSPIQAITTADLDGDGQQEILVGAGSGELRVLGADKTLMWQYEAAGPISPLVVADLFTNEGEAEPVLEVLIGDGASELVALSGGLLSEGQEQNRVLWRWPADSQAPTAEANPAETVNIVTVADLTDDNFPEILVVTADFNLYALDSASGEILWNFSTAGNRITSLSTANLAGDASPEVLVGSPDRFAYVLDNQGKEQWRFCTAEGVAAMTAADLNGDGRLELLVGARDGAVYALDGAGPGPAQGLVNNVVQAIWDDGRDTTWFGTPCGVSRYDNQSWKTYTTRNGLVHDSVTAIWDDGHGVIWFGTREGLSRFDGQEWSSFTFSAQDSDPLSQTEPLASSEVVSLWGDSVGSLWVATPESIYHYDGTVWTSFSIEDLGLKAGAILTIWGDAQNRIWAGTTTGVSRYTGASWVPLDIPQLANSSVSVIWGDDRGLIWVGIGQTLFPLNVSLDANTLEPSGEKEWSLSDDHQWLDIWGNGNGQIWAATTGELFYYDGVDWSQLGNYDDLLTIAGDERGHLWLGTEQGARRLQGESVPVAPPGMLWFYQTDRTIQSLTTGDLDGQDGLELVVGSPERVIILDAAGNFQWQHSSPGFLGQASLVETETKLPAIFIQDTAGAVILRRSGQVIEQISYSGANRSGLAVFSDLNGDSIGEIIVPAGHHLRLFGYRTGQKLERDLRWTFPIASPVNTLDSGDVDGDGHHELVAGSLDGRVYVLREGAAVEPVFIAAASIEALRVTDLSVMGDDKDEIIVASGDGRVQVISGEGGATWVQPEVPQSDRIPLMLTVADLDVTGAPEIVVGFDDGHLEVLPATGDVPLWQFSTGGYISALTAGDLNGDALPELLVGSGDNTLYVLRGIAGISNEQRVIWRYELGDVPTAVSSIDLDSEGQIEVLARTNGGQIFTFNGRNGELLGQSFIAPARSMTAADLDGDGRREILIDSSEGEVYALSSQPGESEDRVIWKFFSGGPGGKNNAKITSMTVADLEDENKGPEVLLGAEDGQVYVLRGTEGISAQVLSRESVGGGVKQVEGVDLDGDDLAEIVVAANDGNIYLFGQTLNQAPLLLNPASNSTPGKDLIYSVDVIDPEGDEIEILPSVALDSSWWFPWPGDAKWRKLDPKKHAGEGKSQPSWISSRFTWWDSRLPTKYRFSFIDGDLTMHPFGELKGPEVPGQLFWRGIIAVTAPVLLLLGGIGSHSLSQRRRRWAESPEGQARHLYNRIARNPAKLLTEIRNIVNENDDAGRILSELHLLYERREDKLAYANIIQGYIRLFGGPDLARSGLQVLISELDKFEETEEVKGIEGREEVLAVYKLLRAGLGANSVPRITALRSQVDKVYSMPTPLVLGLQGLDEVLQIALLIIDLLERYQKALVVEAKVRYLGLAVESLGQLERNVRQNFIEPRRSLLGELASRWLSVVNNALRELQGRPELKMALKQRQVLAIGEVSLRLELRNEGNAPAENVRIELLASNQYELLDEAKILPSLPSGLSDSVEFRLRPQVDESFRARFRISYDDEQQRDRSLPFADQVNLKKIDRMNGKFQPIDNPYTVGPPLNSGSPLFFGREDVFDFIRQNLGGRYQENVLVLIGQRRIGKTSLLKQLSRKLDERYIPIYIDGQNLGIDPGMVNFFSSLSRHITETLQAEQHIPAYLPPQADFEAAPSETFEKKYLAKLQETLDDRRLVLIFDEFEALGTQVQAGNLDKSIFSFMRHLMQHYDRLAFIFVGNHKLEQLAGDYWSSFFNIALYRNIRFLEHAAARQLVTQPVSGELIYDDLAVDEILHITACHPYFLQLMCHTLFQHLTGTQRNYVTVEDVRETIDDIFERGEAHFRFIWENATFNERLVLGALASLLSKEIIVTSSDIVNELNSSNYQQVMDPSQISATLSGLAAQDIVEELLNPTTSYYRFKLDLIRRWIRRYKPLSKVVEEVT